MGWWDGAQGPNHLQLLGGSGTRLGIAVHSTGQRVPMHFSSRWPEERPYSDRSINEMPLLDTMLAPSSGFSFVGGQLRSVNSTAPQGEGIESWK